MARARAGPSASATASSSGSWCKARSRAATSTHPPRSDEGLSSVGGALTDARDEDTAAGRMLARATRDQVVDGDVVIGPKREAAEETREDASEHTAMVLASGGLGLISLPERDHRLTIEEIEGLHPGLIGTLVDHPGIGFVMVRSDGDGAVVLGAGGRRRLRDDRVTGRDPLLDFGPNAADHLRRTDGFAHCPDILVNCLYDPEANEVAPVRGVHGVARGARRVAEPTLRPGPDRVERARRRRSSGCAPCTTRSEDGSPKPA